jgi:hypothetical protein
MNRSEPPFSTMSPSNSLRFRGIFKNSEKRVTT